MGETKEDALDALADDCGMWDVRENADIYEAGGVLSTWANAYPFGDEESKTCKDYINEIIEFEKKEAERKEWEARQKKLF